MKVLFLHGWNSVLGGVKPSYLQNKGIIVINPALDNDDFKKAVATAQGAFDSENPDVIVGSSRGRAVAMNIKNNGVPLVLLCPAWKNWGIATTIFANSVLLHSKDDEVIPFANSEELIANSKLSLMNLIVTGNDHRLADAHSLEQMYQQVLRSKKL